MANKYPHIFATAEVYHSLRVFQKLLEPYTDMKHNAGVWRTWFNVGYLVEIESINYASKETGISISHIRNKMPEVTQFANDVINYLPGLASLSVPLISSGILNVPMIKSQS